MSGYNIAINRKTGKYEPVRAQDRGRYRSLGDASLAAKVANRAAAATAYLQDDSRWDR